MVKSYFGMLHLTRGDKALAMAYGAMSAMSAGMTMLIMSDVTTAIPVTIVGYETWVAIVGAFSGALALYATRNWMSLAGRLGTLRAMVGGCISAFLAAVIAGTLIVPFYGTLFAPVLLLTAFTVKPYLVLAWFGIVMMAHLLLVRHDIELRRAAREEDLSAIGQLSDLSKAQLYPKRRRLN